MQSAVQQSLHLVEPLLRVKEEFLSENDSLALCPVNPAIKLETCPCTGDCLECLQMDEHKETTRNDSLASFSADDSHCEPSDWVSGATSDSEEGIVDDALVAISAASISLFPIKVEPLSDDTEWLSPFASPQPASPSIVVKGETCPCTGDCLDCLPQRSHSCPECDKTFSSNSHLTIHLRVHTGERPYVCAQCPKTFKELGHLTRHQLTHQAVRSRPFRCTAEGCGKAFTTNGNLTVHFRSHTGHKPYKCDNCGKGFTTSSKLTVHLRTHSGDKPYRCPLCLKAFSQSSSAKTHQQNACKVSLKLPNVVNLLSGCLL